MSNVHYHFEDIDQVPLDFVTLTGWLQKAAKKEGFDLREINYVYCSDEYLLNMNREYLNHDYYTDIITFDNTEEDESALTADMFISLERVKENANTHKIPFDQEVARVMIHGLLHIMGYGDKTPGDQHTMREKEDSYLSLLPKK